MFVAAADGLGKEFLHTARGILNGIKKANPMAPPGRDGLLEQDDCFVFQTLKEANAFLWEE